MEIIKVCGGKMAYAWRDPRTGQGQVRVTLHIERGASTSQTQW